MRSCPDSPTGPFSRSPISHRLHGSPDTLPTTYKTTHRASSTVCFAIRIPLTRHFCYRAGGRCLIENATQGVGTSEGENEETDQADYAPRSDGRNQPALSSGGSKREEVDSG